MFFYSIPHRPSKGAPRSGAPSVQQYAPTSNTSTTLQSTVAPSSSQIWSKAQSTDSLNNEMTPLSSHYSENIRNSSYFMSSGPQSMMLFRDGSSAGSGSGSSSTAGSGASSLPYISRSLSIDAYTQQQLEMGSKKSINSNRNSELEEYAKRYEAIGDYFSFF